MIDELCGKQYVDDSRETNNFCALPWCFHKKNTNQSFIKFSLHCPLAPFLMGPTSVPRLYKKCVQTYVGQAFVSSGIQWYLLVPYDATTQVSARSKRGIQIEKNPPYSIVGHAFHPSKHGASATTQITQFLGCCI